MNNHQPFEEATYRSQVLRLREMAVAAIKNYPLRPVRIEFIHHGENATFCLHMASGRKYLLRIHRGGYHSALAINEELAWLRRLSARGHAVPNPIRTKAGRYLATISTPRVSSVRHCCVFEWVEGRFLEKSVKPRHLFELGQLIATLQASAPRSNHRRYWNADGLVGAQPKFGSVAKLIGVDRRHLAIVNEVRPKVFKALKRFEKDHPEKMGFIHADLHFGNIVLTQRGLAAIDFDDSGYGFLAYDLVIPLMSVENLLKKEKRMRELSEFRGALLQGYASRASWTEEDEAMILHLTAARRIAMLGWLHTRSDNPRLKKHLKSAAKVAANYLRTNYLD